MSDCEVNIQQKAREHLNIKPTDGRRMEMKNNRNINVETGLKTFGYWRFIQQPLTSFSEPSSRYLVIMTWIS